MNPCIDYCWAKFNRQYTTECNEHCDYAKACLKLAEADASVERLQTLADLGNMRANDYRVMRDRAIKAEEENEKLRAELEQVKQCIEIVEHQRDEAIYDMTALMAGQCCDLCAVEYCNDRGKTEMCTAFKWRGPQKED